MVSWFEFYSGDDDSGNGHLAITLLATSKTTTSFVWEIRIYCMWKQIALSPLPSMSCAHLRNEKGVALAVHAVCLISDNAVGFFSHMIGRTGSTQMEGRNLKAQWMEEQRKSFLH